MGEHETESDGDSVPDFDADDWFILPRSLLRAAVPEMRNLRRVDITMSMVRLERVEMVAVRASVRRKEVLCDSARIA